jgi:hypothetical protein
MTPLRSRASWLLVALGMAALLSGRVVEELVLDPCDVLPRYTTRPTTAMEVP